MKSVVPALHENAMHITFAVDQPQYDPLVASIDPEGCVMTEWEPSAEDLARLMNGGRIRLWLLHTGVGVVEGAKLTPIGLETIEGER